MKKSTMKLYSLMLTVLSTLTVLGVFLRPPDGWMPQITAAVERWTADPVYRYEPLVLPTPTQPRYVIRATLDEAAAVLRGEMTVTVPELRLDGMPFYLYSPSGAQMRVSDVTVNGEPVEAKVSAKQVTVPAVKSATPQTVSLRFETALPKRPTRTGAWQGVYTVSYWYPILAVERDGEWVPRPDPLGFGDPYLMDAGDYDVELDSPASFKWYTSGPRVSEAEKEGGRKTFKWTAENVRNFALVGGAAFQETQFATGTGTQVFVAVTDPAKLQQTAELARSAVKTFTEKVGMSPYPVLNVVELPKGTVYAHELPNLALFSQDLWGYEDPEHWIVHEVGHVWFYNSVGNYEVETPWLDEGLTDYIALVEQEMRLGPEHYRKTIAEAWERYRQNQTYTPYKKGTPSGVNDGISAAPYGSFATSQAHYYYNYLRPILMYHDIRQELGDDRFFLFLRQYYTKNVGQTATRANLERALADVNPDSVKRLNLWLDTPNGQLIEQIAGRFQ